MWEEKYEQYVAHLQKVHDINCSIALLHWDKQVSAPPKGSQVRSRQLATLSALSHEWMTDEHFGKLLETLYQNRQNLEDSQARNVELSFRDYTNAKKRPNAFVKELSIAKSQAFEAWIKARRAKDFQLFKPALHKMIVLKKQEAEYLGYENHPYEALMDDFEGNAKVPVLDALFAGVKAQLVDFAKHIRMQKHPVSNGFLKQKYDKDKQWDFGLDLLRQMAYDFEAGRQDLSEHPFTINFGSTDVRVTTAIQECDPMSMISSCIHEGGHALYEQGLDIKQYGLPLGFPTSLSIHESQSRLWENNVGLSRAYWKNNFPKMQAYFPEQLKEVKFQDFYRAINRIQPNLIRIESDELHYHLHVLIRYEIEKGLIDGTIEVENLDQVWNQKYKDFLGVEVPDDFQGVLQDVHWSEGLIGYFPTYSLGSFYAAQFFAQAKEEIKDLELQIERGDMLPLRNWLKEKIHIHGRAYTSEELCKKVTGKPLDLQYFMTYIREKYQNIYQLTETIK